MYDVLVYLFENCQQAEVSDDRERVARKLSAAGFEDSDISEALHWLAGVARTREARQVTANRGAATSRRVATSRDLRVRGR